MRLVQTEVGEREMTEKNDPLHRENERGEQWGEIGNKGLGVSSSQSPANFAPWPGQREAGTGLFKLHRGRCSEARCFLPIQ